jgi:hypothetical protein
MICGSLNHSLALFFLKEPVVGFFSRRKAWWVFGGSKDAGVSMNYFLLNA